MAENTILVEDQQGIRTLRFNRPDKRNAFSVAMYQELIDALETAAQDSAVRVVVLTGEGKAFTSGNDLVDFMNTPPAGPDSPVFKFLLTLLDYEKPLVAAVNGAAVGIGTTMLLHCDLVVASDSAKFQVPFVNLGLVPEGGSSLLLPALAGHRKAAELLLLGEAFSAQDAKDFGLVNSVVPADELESSVNQLATRLSAQPAASVRATKRLLKQPVREVLLETLHREGEVFISRLTSPEAAEAFTAFFEKRKPDFSKFD